MSDVRKAWGSWDDYRTALREAERRASRVGGDVIPLPVTVAPPPIGETLKRTRQRFEHLGLTRLPAEAEIQRALIGRKYEKAVAIMQGEIEKNTPPRGYQRSLLDPHVWVRVEGGTPVAYWCEGREYTPAEWAEAFNGGFDPGAKIEASAPTDLAKGDVRSPQYDSHFHDGREVVPENLDLTLFDVFGVNGGGFDI